MPTSTTIAETIKVRVPPLTVTGRNIAHGHRTPIERAFLVADLLAGRVQLQKMTAQQLAAIVRASIPDVQAAQLVSTDPWLRKLVVDGSVSMMDAVETFQTLHPIKKKKPVQTEITAAEFVELFHVVGSSTRAECMRAFKDEALDIVDTVTAPAPKGNGSIHSHA